jgi:hypothetical protein
VRPLVPSVCLRPGSSRDFRPSSGKSRTLSREFGVVVWGSELPCSLTRQPSTNTGHPTDAHNLASVVIVTRLRSTFDPVRSACLPLASTQIWPKAADEFPPQHFDDYRRDVDGAAELEATGSGDAELRIPGSNMGTFRRYSAYDAPCSDSRSLSSNWIASTI